MGYGGIAKSVGIEFDTWNNGNIDDHNGNHVGIDINGSVDSVLQASVWTRLNNGEVWWAWVDYDGNNNILEVRVSQTSTRPTAHLLRHDVDLASVLESDRSFVGFTAAVGGAFQDHHILSWKFVNQFAPDVTCNGLVATIIGATSPIKGTDGDDVIIGTGGDDEILGKGGNDTAPWPGTTR